MSGSGVAVELSVLLFCCIFIIITVHCPSVLSIDVLCMDMGGQGADVGIWCIFGPGRGRTLVLGVDLCWIKCRATWQSRSRSFVVGPS